MGANRYDTLINNFVENGKLDGTEVLSIVSLNPAGRYAAMGRVVENQVKYYTSSTSTDVESVRQCTHTLQNAQSRLKFWFTA
jgi:hypothetical protein